MSDKNKSDPTSFESILAGVKRLRESNGDTNNDDSQTNKKPSSTHPAEKPQLRSAINNNRAHQEGRSSYGEYNKDNRTSSYNSNAISQNKANVAATGKTVLVNSTQRENPLLNQLKNTNWRYYKPPPGTKIYYDYFIKGRSVLFLTLTYHKLYSDYIDRRMKPLIKNDNNILLFVVDDNNSEDPIKDLTKVCMSNGFTLLLAFNFEQAAKYIEYLNS